jgi:hypothetical protein
MQLFSETEYPIVRRALGLGSSEHFAGSDGGWLTADISDTDDSDRKVRRTAKTQKGKEKCVIPNHCGKPNRKMYELCGETIIRELLTRPVKKLRNGREANSCRISFEKNGRRYHVLKMKSENGGSELIFHCYERL